MFLSGPIKFARERVNVWHVSGYLTAVVRKYLSEVEFADKKTAPQQRNKSTRKKTTTFCYTIPPSLTYPNENTNEEIAPYTKPTTAKINL